jgi:hypothetical protein
LDVSEKPPAINWVARENPASHEAAQSGVIRTTFNCPSQNVYSIILPQCRPLEFSFSKCRNAALHMRYFPPFPSYPLPFRGNRPNVRCVGQFMPCKLMKMQNQMQCERRARCGKRFQGNNQVKKKPRTTYVQITSYVQIRRRMFVVGVRGRSARNGKGAADEPRLAALQMNPR